MPSDAEMLRDPDIIAAGRQLRRAGMIGTRVVHRAGKVRGDGAVSAVCFKTPRPINLRVASWNLRDEAVTCPKCKALASKRGG